MTFYNKDGSYQIFLYNVSLLCIAINSAWQDLYEEWGSGQNDVEFLEVSILVSDTNAKVKPSKNSYGLTMHGIGWDEMLKQLLVLFKMETMAFGGELRHLLSSLQVVPLLLCPVY